VNAEWFYSVGDTRQGPVTEEELKRLAADGKLQRSDLVWKDGMKDWVEARSVEILFPRREGGGDDRPSRRRFDPEGERPGRSKRADDFDDDRPSRRDRRDEEDDDDRPRVRRDDWEDEYEDRPRRKKLVRPGQVQAVAIMLLVGGILGVLTGLTLLVIAAPTIVCCFWPGIYLELIWGILAIIRAANMLGRDDQGPPRTLAILQIICIINADVINCVLGIVSIVMLNAPEVVSYYRKKGFES
jgi:GYF domain 2